jgi:hypothetical protein
VIKLSVKIVKRRIKIYWPEKKKFTTNIELDFGQVIYIIKQMSLIEEIYDDI